MNKSTEITNIKYCILPRKIILSHKRGNLLQKCTDFLTSWSLFRRCK